jgi:hypothetical protein
MNIQEQKEQMNQMLDYLGRNTYSIEWKNNSNYVSTLLVYSKKDSILTKEKITYNVAGKVVAHDKKEKAMGGTNGDDIYNAIKKAVREKAEKIIMNRLVQRELEDNNVFL